MSTLPLKGIRIVGNTLVWGGPYAEMLLADWGAEVIRIESIAYFAPSTRGILARPSEAVAAMNNPTMSYPNSTAGARPWNRCSFHNVMARNKLSMTVDPKKSKGLEIVKRLIAKSDVVIDNNRFGTLEKLGLGYDELKKVKGDIILVSITSYGRSGPYRDFRSMAVPLEAYTGHTLLRGYPDLSPMSTTSVFHPDNVAGANAALAIMMALHRRRRTGEGQLIELSMAEACVCQLGEVMMDYTMNGVEQGPIGNRHPTYAPCGCYPSKGEDRWINITVTNDEEWATLCRAIGAPELAADSRFDGAARRHLNHDDLDELLSTFTRQHDHHELMHLLQEAGVPAGAVLDERETFADPHLNQRGFFEEMTHQDCGTHRYPGLMWRMAKTPNHIRKPPICLGEDNEYVYKTILGVSDAEYAELEQEGHIGTEYLPGIA